MTRGLMRSPTESSNFTMAGSSPSSTRSSRRGIAHLQQVFSSRALIRYRSRDNQKLRLFCFPYAGGSAASYREWSDALAGHVDVVAIEYPGRGARRREQLLTRITGMVDALLPDIKSAIDGP